MFCICFQKSRRSIKVQTLLIKKLTCHSDGSVGDYGGCAGRVVHESQLAKVAALVDLVHLNRVLLLIRHALAAKKEVGIGDKVNLLLMYIHIRCVC